MLARVLQRLLKAIAPDGKELWSRVLTTAGASMAGGMYYSVDTSPVIAKDGTLYVARNFGTLYAVSPDGDVLWEAETSGGFVGLPAPGDDGKVYIASYSDGLLALGPNGRRLWRNTALGRNAYQGLLMQLGGDGKLYALEQNTLHCLAP